MKICIFVIATSLAATCNLASAAKCERELGGNSAHSGIAQLPKTMTAEELKHTYSMIAEEEAGIYETIVASSQRNEVFASVEKKPDLVWGKQKAEEKLSELTSILAHPEIVQPRETQLAHDFYKQIAHKFLELEIDVKSRRKVEDHLGQINSLEQKVVVGNLRFAIAVAGRTARDRLPKADAIQAGTMGLMRAASKFESKMGFQFSTYAGNWIRQMVARTIENEGDIIRIPSHARPTLAKIKTTQEWLRGVLNRKPTHAEIAAHLKIEATTVSDLLEASNKVASIDATIAGSDDDSLSLGATLFQKDAASPEDLAIQSEAHAQMRHVLAKLKMRDRKYLLDLADGASISEIAKKRRQSPYKARKLINEKIERLKSQLLSSTDSSTQNKPPKLEAATKRRAPHAKWSRESVISALRALNEINPGLLPASVLSTNKSKEVKSQIEKTVGFSATGVGLYARARYYFDSYDMALEAAGLNPQSIRKTTSETAKWGPKRVIRLIQALKESGIELSYEQLHANNEASLKAISQEIVGAPIEGYRLLVAGTKYFGNWSNALEAAGLDSAQIKKRFERNIAWSKESIVQMIKKLGHDGLDLRPSAVSKNTSSQFVAAAKAVVGAPARGHSFFSAAVEHFGSWREALRAADVAVDQMKWKSAHSHWTPEKILSALRALHENNPLLLPAGKIQRDITASTTEIIKEATGETTTGRSFYLRVRHYFKQYDDALLAAGIDPATVRIKGDGISWTREKVLAVLQNLNSRGIDLIKRGAPRAAAAELEAAGRDVVGQAVNFNTLRQAAIKHAGGLKAAIEAARELKSN